MGSAGGRQSIFITGAASGMGRETARLFAAKGWFVGLFDVNEAGLAALASELGAAQVVTARLDVADRVQYDQAVRVFSQASDGRMDLLFNNAGMGAGGPFEALAYETAMAIIQVNFVGVVNGIYASLDLLKATPNALCMSTASSSATFGMAGLAVYSATKHAVKGLTEALSVEFKTHGVRVADVLPGLIDTAMVSDAARARAPRDGMWRLVHPREIAEAVWEAYHGDKLHYYVPRTLALYDRWATENPEQARDGAAPTDDLFAGDAP